VPDSELHILMTTDHDVDMGPNEEWIDKQDELATLFVDFLNRVTSRTSV